MVSQETASSSAECSRHSAPSEDRIRQCGTSSGSRRQDTDLSASCHFPHRSVPVLCENGSVETTVAEEGQNPVAGLWGHTRGGNWPLEPTSSYTPSYAVNCKCIGDTELWSSCVKLQWLWIIVLCLTQCWRRNWNTGKNLPSAGRAWAGQPLTAHCVLCCCLLLQLISDTTVCGMSNMCICIELIVISETSGLNSDVMKGCYVYNFIDLMKVWACIVTLMFLLVCLLVILETPFLITFIVLLLLGSKCIIAILFFHTVVFPCCTVFCIVLSFHTVF